MRVPAAHTVTRGSKDVVIPHGYLTLNPETGQPLFYQGTDFTYPGDNVGLLAAFDNAYRAGCLIFKGTADNRGRQVATANAAVDQRDRRGVHQPGAARQRTSPPRLPTSRWPRRAASEIAAIHWTTSGVRAARTTTSRSQAAAWPRRSPVG